MCVTEIFIIMYERKLDIIPEKGSRSKIVEHELRESLNRTAFGMCYDEAHNKAGGIDTVNRFRPWK